MRTNEQTTTVGSLTITRKTRCNRIVAVAVGNDFGHTFHFCATCGRDLESATSAAGFFHTSGYHALDLAATR